MRGACNTRDTRRRARAGARRASARRGAGAQRADSGPAAPRAAPGTWRRAPACGSRAQRGIHQARARFGIQALRFATLVASVAPPACAAGAAAPQPATRHWARAPRAAAAPSPTPSASAAVSASRRTCQLRLQAPRARQVGRRVPLPASKRDRRFPNPSFRAQDRTYARELPHSCLCVSCFSPSFSLSPFDPLRVHHCRFVRVRPSPDGYSARRLW